MKEPKNQKRNGEKLSFAALTKVRPVPFGDVRKYYLAAKVGTVILLALCFHVSMAAIALRTYTCEQLSTALIVMMLLAAIAVIVGHYMRSLLGYGISAAAALLLILLLQFGNGGAPVALTSDLFDFGEVFRDGAKSTDFWILLAKIIAVVHLLLTVLFIRSALTVTEEPRLKGMNVQIKRFTDWCDKNNNSFPPGRRASDYWFVAAVVLSCMAFWAFDPSMTKYDFWSLAILAAGCVLVALKAPFAGSFLMACSSLIRCTLYQFRFGFSGPVVVAYAGMLVSLLYLGTESFLKTKQKEEASTAVRIVQECFVWTSVAVWIAIVPVHEFLAVFSGDKMVYQKDNLPLLFFLPILVLLVVRTGRWYAYLFAALGYIWLWYSINYSNPYRNQGIVCFNDFTQHGSIGEKTTERLMALVNIISVAAVALGAACVVFAVILLILRRKNHGSEA